MEYREFLSLTDEEVKFILNDIFFPKAVGKITRDEKWNEITAEMTTEWGSAEDEDGIIEITDEIVLSPDEIRVDFQTDQSDFWKWKQFLLAKGCNELFKDNPYL